MLPAHLLSKVSKWFGFCRFWQYTAHCKNASAVVNNTNTFQDVHLFNTCTVCVFVPAFTHRLQYEGAAAPPILHPLAFFFFSFSFWITGVTRGTFICPALDCVFNMCTNCWTTWSGSELHCPTLSVFNKNIFQRSVKRCWCFYNLCLGLLKGENLGLVNIFCPPCNLLPVPSRCLSPPYSSSPIFPFYINFYIDFSSHTSFLICVKSLSVSFLRGEKQITTQVSVIFLRNKQTYLLLNCMALKI